MPYDLRELRSQLVPRPAWGDGMRHERGSLCRTDCSDGTVVRAVGTVLGDRSESGGSETDVAARRSLRRFAAEWLGGESASGQTDCVDFSLSAIPDGEPVE